MSESIQEASREGKILTVKALLKENPSSVLSQDGDGRTALMWAISSGHIEIASEIMKVMREDTSIKAKLDVDVVDQSGWAASHIAASVGQLALLKQLSQDFNADLELKTSSGQTLLQLAISKNHMAVVDWLISKGVSTRSKDNYERTALQRAAANGNLDAVKKLIAAKTPLNASDKDGWTALHHAMAEGQVDVAVELIKAGADQDKLNKEGETVFQVAEEKIAVEVKRRTEQAE